MTTKKVKEPVEPCPCKIEKMEMVCSHGRRSDVRGFLEIVADTTKTIAESLSVGPSGLSIEVEKVVSSEGSEDVTIELFSGAGCKDEIKISGPNIDGKFVSGKSRTQTFTVEPWATTKEANPRFVFEHASPTYYNVTGKTIAGQKAGRIVQYPGDKFEHSLKIDGLSHIVDKFNKAWEKWGGTAFGWSPASITPKLKAPVGSFKTETYFKEDSEQPHVCHVMAIEAGLDPFFGIAVRIDVSMMACLGASVGVPPVAAKMMGKHLADIIVSAELGLTSKIVGKIEEQTIVRERKKTTTGELNVGFEGYFLLAITARLGSDYIVSVAAVGQAKITIANDNKINFSSEEVSFQSEVYLKPMELKVTVKAHYLVIFSKSKSKTWKLWKEDKNIWKGDKRVIVNFNKTKGSK